MAGIIHIYKYILTEDASRKQPYKIVLQSYTDRIVRINSKFESEKGIERGHLLNQEKRKILK
jgi:hypothetical protein